MWRFGVVCHQYADETQLYCSVSANPQLGEEILECCLEGFGDWMRVNKLKLNPDKTEVLLVEEPEDIKLSTCSEWGCTPTARASSHLGVL